MTATTLTPHDLVQLDSLPETPMASIAIPSHTPWLTARQTSARLQISLGTLYNWISRGEGPTPHKIHGGRVLFHIEDVDAWVRSCALEMIAA